MDNMEYAEKHPEYTGWLAGRVGDSFLPIAKPFLAGDNLAFRGANENLVLQFGQMLSGAEVPEPQYKRIMKTLPNPTMQPEQYQKAAKKALELIELYERSPEELRAEIDRREAAGYYGKQEDEDFSSTFR